MMIPTTFRHAARKWYNDLKPGSISSFDEFRQKFLTHFMGSKSIRKPPAHLMTVRQRENESLQEYVKRFNKEANDIYGSNDTILLTAFIHGVKPGHFNRSLTQDYPKDFMEALRRAGRAIKAEESDKCKQEIYGFNRNKRRQEQTASHGEEKRGRLSERLTFPPKKKFGSQGYVQAKDLTPLNATRAEILFATQGEGVLKKPGRMRAPDNSRDRRKWCHNHSTHGHDTEDCIDLIQEIERGIRRGELKRYIARSDRQPYHPRGRENDKSEQEDRQARKGATEKEDTAGKNTSSGVAGTIYTISGGPTYGDSKSARKAYVKAAAIGGEPCSKRRLGNSAVITFSDDDHFLPEPTDDALVIDAFVANFQVKRVLVDSGSSVNVMYDNVFDGCSLERSQVERVRTPVVGFANIPVPPIGRIKLPMTPRDGDKVRTETLEYLVMKGPSAYNMLLGRPGINRFGAIPSNFHLVMKFPTAQGDKGRRKNSSAVLRGVLENGGEISGIDNRGCRTSGVGQRQDVGTSK